MTTSPLLTHVVYFIRNRQIFVSLINKGHNLTILSPDIDKESTPNLHYIWSEKVYSTLYNGSDAINIMDMADENAVMSFHKWALLSCKGFFESDGFQRLLNYPDDFKFDLALVDFNCGLCLYSVFYTNSTIRLLWVCPPSVFHRMSMIMLADIGNQLTSHTMI